jgi:hypothetical protein
MFKRDFILIFEEFFICIMKIFGNISPGSGSAFIFKAKSGSAFAKMAGSGSALSERGSETLTRFSFSRA